MRTLLILLVATTALAQTTPQTRISRITENLRGVSAVTQKIAWASGTHGTYLRTTDGHIWIPDHVPGAESLDFRGIVAFSADEAFLTGTAAAGAIALINAIGNLGGYVGPFVVGWIKDSTNSFEAGLYFLAACALLGAVITFFATEASGGPAKLQPTQALASR